MNESENPLPNESGPPAEPAPAPLAEPTSPPSADGGEASPEVGPGGEPGAHGPRRRRRRRRGRRGADGQEGEGAEAAGEPGDGDGPPRQQPRPPQRQQQHQQQRQPQHQQQHQQQGRRDRGAFQRPQRDSAHLATQAVRALAEMAQQLLRIEGVDPLAMPRYLDLALRVPLDFGKDVRHAAGTAVEQILKRVREVREHEQALRPGAVFSYFAGSSDAEGCRPIEARHVFDGYSSTGKPVFADFVTMAIERKDPDIERLLAGEDVVLTQVTMGRVLRTQQLVEFGGNSPVFKILGQVNAGLFRVLHAAGKCAFSFQLLRGATLEGRVRLRLHAVGAVDPMDLADPAILQILSRFQRRLDAEAMRLEGRMQNGETDEEAFVLPLLQDLARQLQNRTRNAGRRTQHGLERSEEGQRPTSRAYPDAGEATDDAIVWDVEQSTVVVLGPKGRVHVFTPDGKHVTSVMMQGSAIDRRRQQGRWRLAEPEERGEFRIRVRQIARAEEANAAAAAAEPKPEAKAEPKPEPPPAGPPPAAP